MNKQNVFKAVALFAVSLSVTGLKAENFAYRELVAKENRILGNIEKIIKTPQDSEKFIELTAKETNREDLISAIKEFAQDYKATGKLKTTLIELMDKIAGKNFQVSEEDPDNAILIQAYPWLYKALYNLYMETFNQEPVGKNFFLKNAAAHDQMRKAQK